MANYTNKQTDLLRRLSKLSGRRLSALSKLTSQFSYQRGYTKHGLSKLIRSTKNRSVLKALEDTISTYEKWNERESVQNVILDISQNSDANVGKFIRIMQNNGWTDTDILIALENSYDIILYMESEDMQRMSDYTVFREYVEDQEFEI